MLGQLFGWDLDSLWQTVNQRRCDVLLRADRVIEAIESYQFVMGMMDAAKTRCLEWSTSECSVSENSSADTYSSTNQPSSETALRFVLQLEMMLLLPAHTRALLKCTRQRSG